MPTRTAPTELRFLDDIPEDILAHLRQEIGEFTMGTRIDRSWPANWYQVYVNRAVERELAKTFTEMMTRAVEKLPRRRAPNCGDWIRAIEYGIKKHLRDLVDAARLPPRVRKWAAEIRQARKDLADGLKAAKKAVRVRKTRLAGLLLDAREHASGLADDWNYPQVPEACVEVTEYGDGLPGGPGVYFVWSGGRVVYVGQSIKLKNRAKIGHHRIRRGEMLSYLEFPVRMLDFAECFYIGIARPTRNFGDSAKHKLA